MRRCPSTRATAVSSQLVSMPRTTIVLAYPRSWCPDHRLLRRTRNTEQRACAFPSSLLKLRAMTKPILRIGSRGSPLALKQAEIVRAALTAAHPALAEPGAIDVVPIRTTGDRIQDRTLAEAGGKGLFTKEIEEALLAGAVDLAVHSAKDMQTCLPKGLAIAAVLARDDPRDLRSSNHRAG